MYNPQNLNECEKEKLKKRRNVVDALMIVVGLVASVSSIPQVVKIYQTGDVLGISLTTQVLALGAVIAWFLYSIYIRNKPLMITSGLTSIILSVVVIQILVN